MARSPEPVTPPRNAKLTPKLTTPGGTSPGGTQHTPHNEKQPLAPFKSRRNYDGSPSSSPPLSVNSDTSIKDAPQTCIGAIGSALYNHPKVALFAAFLVGCGAVETTDAVEYSAHLFKALFDLMGESPFSRVAAISTGITLTLSGIGSVATSLYDYCFGEAKDTTARKLKFDDLSDDSDVLAVTKELVNKPFFKQHPRATLFAAVLLLSITTEVMDAEGWTGHLFKTLYDTLGESVFGRVATVSTAAACVTHGVWSAVSSVYGWCCGTSEPLDDEEALAAASR